MTVAYNKRSHRCGELRAGDVGKNVLLAGWVNTRRDHGGLTFVDLRDHSGITQLRFTPDTHAAAHEVARGLHNEDVIAITGKVLHRGEWVNPKIPTGEVEVEISEIDVLSRSKPLPFQINDDFEANEDLCLEYRFLHLRRPEMQRIFRIRHTVARTIRNYFADQGFVEIETPFLTKSTPEAPATTSSRRAFAQERSTLCRSLRSCSSNCIWSPGLTGTRRSSAASATKTCGPIANRSSPSSIWKWPSSNLRTSSPWSRAA